jgi:hypothetical protein
VLQRYEIILFFWGGNIYLYKSAARIPDAAGRRLLVN